MAKKETKAGLLPKRLEGVKIPKGVRESLVKLAKNPVVADLLAAGLVALAAKLRDDPKDKKPAPKAKGKTAEAADPVLEATTELATAAAAKAVASVRKATGAKAPAPRKPAARKPAAKAPAKTAAAKPAEAKLAPVVKKAPAAKPPARRAPRKAPAKPKSPPKTGG